MSQQLKIPGYESVRIFFDRNLSRAMAAGEAAGYRLPFMPEVIDAKLSLLDLEMLPRDGTLSTYNKLWHIGLELCTPSIAATGKTNVGAEVVVFAHVPNYFSDSKNIVGNETLLRCGRSAFPQDEFNRLVGLDGMTNEKGDRLVSVIDYRRLKRISERDLDGLGETPVRRAINHPQTIPFVGGSKRAKRYLKSHAEEDVILGSNIYINYCEDMHSVPVASFLSLGEDGGLFVGNAGHFIGVRDIPKKTPIQAPPLEKLVAA